MLGMARRPFDPGSLGLSDKTEYRQGDILDPDALEELFAEADVAVHLAFIIVGGKEETRRINLEGSRNVFAAAARCERLVYTSSVAAYGFHADNPVPLTEDVPTRGSDEHYYSAQKAELEAGASTIHERATCSGRASSPAATRCSCIEMMPGAAWRHPARPTAVIPDPGVRFQLVHTEDVAKALLAGDARPRRARRLQPRRRRGADDVRLRGRARLARPCPCPKAGGRRLTAAVVSRAPLLPRRGLLDQRLPHDAWSWTRARRRRSCAGP